MTVKGLLVHVNQCLLCLRQVMEEWGNGRANLYYEANMPSHVSRPQDGDSVRMIEKFIRDKYELKRYSAKELPPKVQASESMEETDDKQMKKIKSVVTRQRPTAPISMSIPVPAAPAPSLINFMDFDDEPAPVVVAPLVPTIPNFAPPALPTFAPSFPITQNQNQTQFHQSVQVTQTSKWAPPSSGGVGFIDFGDFVSPVPALSIPQQQLLPQQKHEQIENSQQSQQQHGGFYSTANEKPPPVPSMPPKPQASADAILSLYAVAPPPAIVNSMTGMNMNNMAGSNGISAMEGMNGGYNMMNRIPQMGNFSSYGQQGQQLQNPQSHMLQQPQVQLQQQMMMQQQQHQQYQHNGYNGHEQHRQLGGMSQMGGNMLIGGAQDLQMQPQIQQQQYFQQQPQQQQLPQHQQQYQQQQQPQYQHQQQQQYQQPQQQQRQQSQQQNYQSYTN